MATLLLLLIIYITFISLGLPDTIFGVAYPLIQEEFSLSLDAAGYVSVVMTLGTVVSSVLSGKIIDKIGTFWIVVVSVLLTAIALLGSAFIPSYYWLFLYALPLGFGAGSIDTALNNYVATHFKAHHMNWLHSFWGIGATLGPLIMSIMIISSSWRDGYLTLGIIQIGFVLIIALSYPLWKKHESNKEVKQISSYHPRFLEIVTQQGVILSILFFVIYTAIEFSIALWGASYLVRTQHITVGIAGRIIAANFFGITIGRFLAGLLSFKFSNRQLIFSSITAYLFVIIGILLNSSTILFYVLFFLSGLCLAAIFPSMIHETPKRFDQTYSHHIIGYQIGGAYAGAAIIPMGFGIVARFTTIALFPWYLLIMTIIVWGLTIKLNSIT